MNVFNQNTRTANVIKTSLISFICSILNLCISFIYRTIFLHILSTAYLGIVGLFSNILLIFSLAELGITSAIIYRFYEPISCKDIQKTGELVNFSKQVYRVIVTIILFLGLLLYPFINFFINDAKEIPEDVDIHLAYILYLIQTVSSYVCAYKQTLLSADQKEYELSLWRTLTNFINYSAQVIILFFSKKFILSVTVGVVVNILMNYFIGIYISNSYKPVFEVNRQLPKEEQKYIFADTKATACHKIGGTIAGGTDNIILSAFVGLSVTGIYSNYSLILIGIRTISSRLLGSFTSSFGNAHVEQNDEEKYLSYRRMLFVDFWISGLVVVCLYNLIDDFITIWIGENYKLNHLTVIILCINFYAELCRAVSTSYIDGCGLFVKDKARPIIEAVLNLSISILLVKRMEIAGVFLGTILSQICTVLWREPYILYKYEFKKSVFIYWRNYVKFAILTLLLSFALNIFLSYFYVFKTTLRSWVGEGIVCVFLYNLAALIIFRKTDDFIFFRNLIYEKIKGIIKGNGKQKK